MTVENPLVKPFDTPFNVPPFGAIEPSHFVAGISTNIESAKKEIDAIAENPSEANFENSIEALERAGEMLGHSASILFNLNAAETNEEIQKATMEVSPMLTEFQNDVSQNEKLFRRVKAVYDNRDKLSLNKEQSMLLEKSYKRFVRSGANLDPEAKSQYRKVTKELAELELTFGENLLHETNSYKLHITSEEDLAGLPDYVKEAAAETAESKDLTGWVFTLQAPSYVPFMEYAQNRAFRQKLFMAFTTKCVKGDQYDNRDIIRKIVELRLQVANLLGYQSYADYVLEERMAVDITRVTSFLDELQSKSFNKAKDEVEEIKEFAREKDGLQELERWDWSYYSHKLKKDRYDISDEMLKPYFKLENVIDGVFKVAKKLYGLSFKQNSKIPAYHQDVKSFEVVDEQGELQAIFYADFFPREGKRGGAWMTNYREQSIVAGAERRPVVSIVCNFTPPSSSAPSLLTFDEVRTLFHEFGHALHSMLAKGTYSSLAGTNVFWDFVELPSQIMENWVFEKECLDLFATHYKDQSAIPQSLIDRLIAASNFHEAYQTLRQISLAKLDLKWHSLKERGQIKDVLAVESEVLEPLSLFPSVEGICMSTQFAHIFSGGYAAGYYSYKWAEVLDADAFAYFKQEGIFNKDVADAFRENILSKGGTEHPMELYKRFRKQEPTIDALLERSGLAAKI